VIARWLASLVLIALAALALGVAFVAGTEPGAAWLAREAGAATGGALRLTGVTGSLARGLAADELLVRAPAATVRATGVTLRLAPAALLGGRLELEALGAARLEVDVIDDGRPPEPFGMPTVSTPLPVAIGGLDVATLVVRRPGGEVVVTGIHLAGELAGSTLTVGAARASLGELGLELEGRAELVPELPLSATLRWAVPSAGVSGAGTLRGTLAALEASQRVDVPEPVAVEARLVDLATAPRLAATASWDAIARDLPGLGATRATAGRLEVAGWLDDWQATLATALAADGWPAAQVAATARGDLARAGIGELRLAGDFGAITARGEAQFAGPVLTLDVSARELRTAAFRPGLDGRLSADLALALASGGSATVRIDRLDGRLMGRPLAGRGELAWAEGVLRFDRVALRAGANRLEADGTLGQRLDGRFRLEAPEPGVLWPGLAGRLSARATVAGTLQAPRVDLTASGSDLALDGSAVAGLELALRVDRAGRIDADVRARGMRSDGTALGDLDASVAGTLAAHRLEARLAGGPVAADLASEGAWTGGALRHELVSARVAEAKLGEWRLDGRPAVSVAPDRGSATAHCWRRPPAALCVSRLEWSPRGTSLVAEVAGLDLAGLERWLPPDLALTGSARATADLATGPDGVAGTVDARLEEAVLYYTGDDEPLVTPLDVASLAATFDAAGARATLELRGGATLRLAATGAMTAPLGPDAPLDVQVTGEIPDVAPLVPLLGTDVELAEVAGRILLDAAVGGSFAAPEITGVARLTGGALALTDVGVKLEDIDVALLGDGSETLRLQGSARAGGPLTLAGEVRPLADGGPTAWVRVRGNRIDAVRLPDRFVQASPDITARYAEGRVAVEGRISIPKADIVIRELPASAASPSPDAVVHDRPPRAVAAGVRSIGGEIALELGRDVRLRAFGLDTKLEGTVNLSQGEDGEPRGYGVVRLKEGKFGAYGKELTIERGTLGFAGPLDDPAIELRASRRVDWEGKSVTAGLQLRGTASRPESRVFAEPAMSEADALSYLISGRPLQSANANDRSAIAGAALSLGVQQTSPLTGKIGSAVTLDELGFEGGTLDETEVVAGKQLNEDLYVRFAYGLFNRVGSVLARYRISRNLSIEAASGEDQSLDVIWSIETD
jgi:translocation and assembly module TamB